MTDTPALFDVSGHTVLVTGGARGIGRWLAEGLLAAGATVLVSTRRPDAAAEMETELAEAVATGRFHAIAADKIGRASCRERV